MPRKRTVFEDIKEGLEEAIAFSRGDDTGIGDTYTPYHPNKQGRLIDAKFYIEEVIHHDLPKFISDGILHEHYQLEASNGECSNGGNGIVVRDINTGQVVLELFDILFTNGFQD